MLSVKRYLNTPEAKCCKLDPKRKESIFVDYKGESKIIAFGKNRINNGL